MVFSEGAPSSSHCDTAFGMHVFIPAEIIISIFDNLDWRTLVRCSAVCRFWKQFIRESLSLQYKIELGADGLVNGPSGGLPVPERIRALHARRAAWRSLAFRRKVTIPVPGECHAYELVGGVFAKAMHRDGSLGMGLTPNPGSRHFNMIKLPTPTGESETVVREDIGMLCRDFAIDPTQDLIALVEQPDAESPSVSVHLRTISTNEKHPTTSVPVITQSLKASFDGAEIQICEDVIAVVSELSSSAYRYCIDFSLISNYAFMMTCRSSPGSIKVYTFRAFGSTTPMMTCTDLLLPMLQPNNHYAEIHSHTAPFTANVPKGAPFGTSEDARIHVLSIVTLPAPPPHSNSDSELGVPPMGHPASFIVIVLNRILLKYADAQRDCALNLARGVHLEVPWEDWGPRHTRWLNERSSHAWLRYVHGPRLVLDFHIHPLRADNDDRAREAADAAEPDVPYTHRLILGPSVLRNRAVFKGGGVESRLPYREVTLKAEVGPYSGFMIDEERVIGLSASTFTNGDMKQVDVFTF
ncbi:hypothetical protein EW145_g6285 [Phellinidium pouzarii]|uniref:F-box domain-containing protein n=1 Tax=Phellinidium pouzarii TaxID=167371 RepID=A0A4S4KX18_9AGAM|nr:hypothetical protein EW145_g6285 [Phellinidium pouzarii]